MLSIQQVTLRMGARILLQDANFTIYERQRVGLVGANGCGKTTLFRLLLGELSADKGEVVKASQWRIGHLAQETPALATPVIDHVCQGDEDWYQLQQEIQQAEETEAYEKLAMLHEKMHVLDGYTIKSRAAEILHGLGFTTEEMQKSVSAFSGGWRMRMNLARLLIGRQDILLLDEPTNHLDLEAILWLEKWLLKYPSAMLIISHDRDFLDGVVNQIIHIENQTAKMYKGDYSTFEQTRSEQLALQHAAWQKQQAQVQHLTKFIDRFKAKASKAKQAQSRMKMLERMQMISPVHADSMFYFKFQNSESKSNPLLVLDNANVNYKDKNVLHNVNLSIPAESRIGILGENGAGKTTLLKALVGRLPLASGHYEAASQIKISYFAQHQVDELILSASPLEHFRQLDKQASEQTLRNFLGSFNFIGDQALSPIQHFSGGEKARLAFALLAWQKPDLLLLDEPTNHLDMEMREALMQALQQYNGAMLIISHDRYLLRACVDEFWLVHDGEVKKFAGDLDDYREWYLSQIEAENKAEKNKKTAAKTNAYNDNKERKRIVGRLKNIETELKKLEAQEVLLAEKLEQPDIYNAENKPALQKILQEKEKIEKAKSDLQEEWFGLSEKIESGEQAENT